MRKKVMSKKRSALTPSRAARTMERAGRRLGAVGVDGGGGEMELRGVAASRDLDTDAFGNAFFLVVLGEQSPKFMYFDADKRIDLGVVMLAPKNIESNGGFLDLLLLTYQGPIDYISQNLGGTFGLGKSAACGDTLDGGTNGRGIRVGGRDTCGSGHVAFGVKCSTGAMRR